MLYCLVIVKESIINVFIFNYISMVLVNECKGSNENKSDDNRGGAASHSVGAGGATNIESRIETR